MTENTHSVRVTSQDPLVFGSEFPGGLPSANVEFCPGPGLTFSVVRVDIRHGVLDSSIVVDLVLKIAAGVATKVVGDLLVDYFKQRKATLTVNGKSVDLTQPESMGAALGSRTDAQ